jgi:class 3 adenylate cyclase
LRSTSLRAKIAFLFLVLSLGPLVLVALIGGGVIVGQLNSFSDRLEKTDLALHTDVVGRNLRSDAFDTATEIENIFSRWKSDLRNWSEEDVLAQAAQAEDRVAAKNGWDSLSEQQLRTRLGEHFTIPLPSHLSEQAASYVFRQAERPDASVVEILVTGLNGLNAVLTRPVPVIDHRAETWWQSASSLKEGFQEAFRDNGRAVVGFALPVINTTSGAAVGVIRAYFNLETIVRALEQKASVLNATIRLVNSSGQILVDTSAQPNNVLLGAEATWSEPHDAGFQAVHAEPGLAGAGFVKQGSFLVGYARTNIADWGILVSQPEQQAMQVLGGLMKTAQDFRSLPWYLALLTGLVFIVVGVLAVLATILISRSITRPLIELSREAQRVQAGDLSAQVAISSKDEVGLLGQAFNTMTAGLRERERERDVFGRVVSPAVREKLLAGQLALGGETRRVTVLFSDIRGFSTMVETMTPQQAVGFLNEYLSLMAEAVQPWGGFINNFIGDAIVVIFGAPLEQPDHEKNAVGAALAMRERLADLNARRTRIGQPLIRSGIGIATGEAVAGQIGSLDRIQYTVIGDAVNVAARLETLTQDFPDYPILVNQATALFARENYALRPLGPHLVKGRKEPVEVWAVLANGKT